jgi:hypothetical protein
VRTQILNIKEQSVSAINDACGRILSLINRGNLRNDERKIELFQSFFINKITNFSVSFRVIMDQVARVLKQERYHEVMQEKDRIEVFQQDAYIFCYRLKYLGTKSNRSLSISTPLYSNCVPRSDDFSPDQEEGQDGSEVT